jgi:ABC-type transport system involved in Fe-S cluster assembly fused permease/ATPase subunit
MVMITPMTDQKKPRRTWWTFCKLWSYLWPRGDGVIKGFVALSIFSLIVSELLKLLVPFFYKGIVDDLAPDNLAMALPIGLILAYGGGYLLSQVFAEVRDGFFAKPEHRAIRQAALEVFRHLHRLSLRFHINKKTGGVTRSIEHGVHGIERMLRFLLFNIIPTLTQILFICVVLWVMFDVEYALVTFASMFFYVVFTFYVTEWRNKYVREMNKQDSEAHGKSVDSLMNFETVKYFCNEDKEAARFDESLQGYEKAAVINKMGLSALNIGQGIISNVGRVVVLLMAASSVVDGRMTVGDFVLINTYLMQVYLPLGFLGFAYREVKQSLVYLEKMLDLLDEPEEIKDRPNAPALKLKGGEVIFEDVYFSYNPNRPILKGISFTVPAGKTTAIVGQSGAGKSTISRLLFRFYDITSGGITVDGQDVRDVTQLSLRQCIGMVPQDTVLFNESLYYNIAYGKMDATPSEVEEAAKAAYLHDFIQQLPDGYQSIVGERGLKLSGGEKQRVAIARAFLKKPCIYLFDEATSSLDTKTEKVIQTNLKEISQDRTTLIIAHRLSTVIHAHEIIVLDQGVIVERGRHSELLKQKGVYAQMWERQLQEV